uniref:NADH-ubiquinone oxidoreductase chain 5 n=2 Tax=Magnusiomyces TaxID=1095182 RepID=A0A8E5J7J5_9ASCO|nr:NADH dehydrogenase subunit 5 [Magnusiomyces ingens]YP_010180081.1 NADH dehydrogenase subunit 5 [Saprochaete ingens]AHY04915.1 NADH dehydrogenase subunit 5 [Magnusiomyces ingens]QUX32925.1 NADH dehydrogenase subunit 5 [Magnusiomyces ingens]QUX32949.1 NADH dehydrogenase subunit 5 [Saprochaete ingens]
MMFMTMFMPMLGSMLAGLLGRWLGYKLSGYVATLSMMMACMFSYMLYYNVMMNNEMYTLNMGKWMYVEYLEMDWSFMMDELTVTMLMPMLTVSSLVHMYALGYMSHDPHQSRFFSMLAMFTGFMVMLVTGDNYLVMFLGWEFIGLASYLLISFWFTRLAAMKSALSALLMNKFGDTFLSMGLMMMIWTFGSLNYNSMFALSQFINTDMLNTIMICFLIGATSKSAQLGLHNWLLSSMEGPTPVSALLHAACLVCAGMYLLIRSSYMLEYSPTVLLMCLWLGGLTTMMAGMMAMTSNDMKKIMALSTMSQLGLMVVAIGLSAYNMSLFHLFCHAMFKALLFMSAGSIMHSMISESQDIRTYGGLLNYLPVTYVCILMASLSLMAFPGLTGFYSKDIIIESTLGVYTISGYIIYWLSLSSATLTTLYSIRLLYLVFYNIPNNNRYTYFNLHESTWFMLIPMIILSFASIFIGYITRDIYLGFGSKFNSMFMHPNNLSIIDTELALPSSNLLLKLLPLMFTMLGTMIVIVLYEFKYSLIYVYNNKLLLNLYMFFNNKLMLDQMLNNIILRSNLSLGFKLNKFVDKGALQILGPRGIYDTLNIIVYNLIKLSTGSLLHFSIYLLSGIIMLLLMLTNLFNISLPSHGEGAILFIFLIISFITPSKNVKV